MLFVYARESDPLDRGAEGSDGHRKTRMLCSHGMQLFSLSVRAKFVGDHEDTLNEKGNCN